MDKETLKMFGELLGSKLSELENRLGSKLEDLENRLDSKLGAMEKKLDKNTMLLEDLTSKVDIIAEMQKSHMDVDEKAEDDLVTRLTERIDAMDLAIRDNSNDVKEFKNRLINVELITSSNWNEIVKLKLARKD
jgi:phosphoenolpyruvate-protein kinase (PTS system EI component)